MRLHLHPERMPSLEPLKPEREYEGFVDIHPNLEPCSHSLQPRWVSHPQSILLPDLIEGQKVEQSSRPEEGLLQGEHG
jgi:hypothetical protein